jgi:hypothetical protein
VYRPKCFIQFPLHSDIFLSSFVLGACNLCLSVRVRSHVLLTIQNYQKKYYGILALWKVDGMITAFDLNNNIS